MQRRLILMRHATAGWKAAGTTDHARSLTPQGQAEALRVARAIVAAGWTPAAVHASDSRRTRETHTCMAPVLPEVKVELHPSLYLGNLRDLQQVAAAWPDSEVGPVLVLGHNPGWEQAAGVLRGAPLSFSPATAVLLQGEGPTWQQALEQPWQLVARIRP